MRTYKDIDTFSDWTNEEQNQFALAVTKGLVLDMVRKANSGHSGGPMSSADFTQILFTEFLNFDPNDPEWFNRDRFVLSAGHESALIYSILTQLGWLNMEDIQNFRQLHSRTPGHPEVEIPGIEATTGPLGQGFGMAVGMATAESMLRSRVGELIDHFTYVVAGDGDFQEPIVLGSASMAGHWGLSRLIVFYDSNNAQISGKVDRSDSSNYAQIFEGFGWHVQEIDGHNHEEIREALEKAQVVDRPSLIIGTTIMAKGSATMEGDHETHGAPLPQDEINQISYSLINIFKENPEEVEMVLSKALDDKDNSRSLFYYTSKLNKSFSHEKKLLLIEVLWEVILSDNEVHDFESNLLRRLAGLLYVSDIECGNAKKRAKERLKVL